MLYKVTADFIVVLHAGFVLFVVLGQVLVMVGGIRGWTWVRNLWFRIVHLLAIGTVVMESWFGIPCPLTVWETSLREKAGEQPYRGDFIAHWVEEMLYFQFPHWVFTLVYSLFGALVVGTLVWLPPRRKATTPQDTATSADENNSELPA